MNAFIKCLLLGGLLFSGALAACGQTHRSRLVVDAGAGYGKENLSWSIAGNASGGNPNIYSELKWKRLSGRLLQGRVEWNCWKRFLVMGEVRHLLIRSGSAFDHDYNGDNRTNEVYGERFASDQGYSGGWQSGLGYRLADRPRWLLSAFAGYCNLNGSLSLLDHTGGLGLDSRYRPHWKGVFVQTSAEVRLTKDWQLATHLSYRQLTYKATADWNLIQTFQHPVSYRHAASGYGLEGAVKLSYHFNQRLAARLQANGFFMETGNGTDRLYLSDGTVSTTQLNGVRSSGVQLSLGLCLAY